MAASVDAASSSSSDEDHEEKERLKEAVSSAGFNQKKDKQFDRLLALSIVILNVFHHSLILI